jgi:exodeoxyribonuclease III
MALEQPDVVCLQEIKAPSDLLSLLLGEMAGYWCYWHGGGGYSGVALHVSQRLSPDRPRFSHPPFDFEHRAVAVDLPDFTVLSLYVPNGGKDFPAKMRFLEALKIYTRELSEARRPAILCGDFNVARTERDVHPKERKPRAFGQLPEERALLEAVIANDLVDVGRALDPDNDQLFTWWAPWRNLRQRNIGWRLDYVLASTGLASRALSCPVQKDVGTSDHAPLVATFS